MKRNVIDNAHLLPKEFHQQRHKPRYAHLLPNVSQNCKTVECFKGHLMKPLKWKEI